MNPWTLFQSFLPKQATVLGTVVTEHTDNTLGIELLGGGVLRITGTAAVGTRVFVRDGRMISEAPELPTVEIEI